MAVQKGGLRSKHIRAFRHERKTARAPDVMVSELETHHRRLSRVGKGNLWKKGFGGGAAVLVGGVVGALLAGSKWTVALVAGAVAGALCLIAWLAIRDTESENLECICDDYKRDILDSIEFVEVEE